MSGEFFIIHTGCKDTKDVWIGLLSSLSFKLKLSLNHQLSFHSFVLSANKA